MGGCTGASSSEHPLEAFPTTQVGGTDIPVADCSMVRVRVDAMPNEKDNVYPFRPKIDRPKIDVGNQLAARRAIQSILQAQRVAVTSRHFRRGQMSARVLVDGELYDVTRTQLESLQAGDSPQDLMLDPVRE